MIGENQITQGWTGAAKSDEPVRSRYTVRAEMETVQKEIENLKDRIAQLGEMLSPVLRPLPPGFNHEKQDMPMEMSPLANDLYIAGDAINLCSAHLSQIIEHLTLH